MKKVLFVLMTLVCIGVFHVLPVRAEENESGIEVTELNQIMVAQEDVEVKEIPDENAGSITSYNSGDPVLVTGETPDAWYQVTYQGKVGYVHKSSLTVSKLDVEELNSEMEEKEAESKMVIEEVERYRAEVKRSRIWGTVIVLLVVGIFATGIVSTVKTKK